MIPKKINEKLYIELYNSGKSVIELSQLLEISERTLERYEQRLRLQGRIKLRKDLSLSKEKTRFRHNEIFQEVQVYLDNAKEFYQKHQDIYADIPLKTKFKKSLQSEDAVVVWSDMHTGMKNKNPVNGEVTYNDEIQKKELEVFLKGTHRFYQLYKPSYNVETFYIFDVGDNITNDRIYEGQQAEITCSVGQQILRTLEYQSNYLKKVAELYPKVVMIKLAGNHGRTNAKPVSEEATSNFEFLLGKLLQERFKDNKRIEIIVPETYLHTVTIRKHKYLLFHGNTIRGTTLNSIERATKELADLAGDEHYDLMVMGHFHTALKLKIKPGVQLLVNGCWIDVDDYAYTKLRKYSSPTQWHFLISNKSPMHNLQEIDLKWR